MIYMSSDYDYICPILNADNEIQYEAIYYINDCRYVDIYDYPPSDWIV